MLATEIMDKALEHKDFFYTVLDIGSGSGAHTRKFLEAGKKVTSVDYGDSYAFKQCPENSNKNIVIGDYLAIDFEDKFDLVWASHVLEHQRNPGIFLEKIFKDLKEGGFLCITVPPLKHQIVGGHVTLWNPLLLVYNLVLAGFDCSDISIKKYGYNISVFLRKKKIENMPNISFDRYDFEKLKNYIPEILYQNCNGNISKYRWEKKHEKS